ncbi:MAG: hypothetical protein WD993_01320 [Thermoleophilaceae bacterium]
MNDEATGREPGAAPEGAPSEEELRAAFEEQMRRIRVEDVLLQTTATLVNLAARRLGLATEPGEDNAAERDIEQARLAIDGVRALVPLCPPQEAESIRQALSQLQMAFAREAGGGAPPAQPSGEGAAGAGADAPGEQQPPESDQDAERAKARAKIWTPPGS